VNVDGLRRNLDTVPPAFNKVGYSATEARHALMGVGEEIGVHIPRFVGTFISQMPGIGKALEAAFSSVPLSA